MCIRDRRADWVKIDDGLFISLSSRTSPPIDLTLLRSTLEKEVPAYMVPEHLGILPSQPLSRNGKVDKGSVKDWAELYCSFCDASDNYIEPNGEIEKKVSSIWSKFLGGRRVGRYDGFFEYGGDSLSATRMISALSKIGIKASLKAVSYTHLDVYKRQIQRFTADGTAVIVVTFAEEINGNTCLLYTSCGP